MRIINRLVYVVVKFIFTYVIEWPTSRPVNLARFHACPID